MTTSAGAIDGRAVDDKEIAAMMSNLALNPLGIASDQEFRILLAVAQVPPDFDRPDPRVRRF